jgi:hypothetical protein
VTLPPCLETIGEHAFVGCGRLARIDLGQTKVRALPSGCFEECFALAVVVLPPVLDTIGQYAFYNCKALARLKFPATLTKIEGISALSCSGLAEADFRECPRLTEIGGNAFYSCSVLREVHFGAGLKSCGNCAFQNCASLT